MSFNIATSVRIALLTILLAGAALSAANDLVPGSPIEPAKLAARISAGTAPVILDVRSPSEFASGHIPGAINIPHQEIADRLSSLKLPLNQEIVVHCQRGGRAAVAEAVLRKAGYENVRDLRGHIKGWRAGGFPIE